MHATGLKAVGVAMVQKVKYTVEYAYEKNTSWQSRKHTKKTIEIYSNREKTTDGVLWISDRWTASNVQ